MDIKSIGARITYLRKQKGYTQVEFARATKYDRTYLSRVESCKQNITVETLIRICKCLDITLKDFFDF